MYITRTNESSVNNKTVLIKWWLPAQPYIDCALVAYITYIGLLLAWPLSIVNRTTYTRSHECPCTVWHSCHLSSFTAWRLKTGSIVRSSGMVRHSCRQVMVTYTARDRDHQRLQIAVIVTSVFSWSTRSHQSSFRMRKGYALQERPILCRFITIIHPSNRPGNLNRTLFPIYYAPRLVYSCVVAAATRS